MVHQSHARRGVIAGGEVALRLYGLTSFWVATQRPSGSLRSRRGALAAPGQFLRSLRSLRHGAVGVFSRHGRYAVDL